MAGFRRWLMGFLVGLMGLTLLELGARVLGETPSVEPGSIPVPAPGRQPKLESAAEAARQGIPLLPGEDGSWRLPVDDVRHLGGVTYRTNQLGLRGPEPSPPDAAVWRVLALGDSSVWGWGVPEEASFVRVAADRLGRGHGRSVEGIIGGVPGHEAQQTLELLRTVGPTLQPDVVVIANLWSDLFLDGGERRDARVRRRVASLRTPLAKSALYQWMRHLLRPLLRARHIAWLDERSDLAALPAADDQSLADYLAALRGLVAESQRLGARPVLLMLPAPADLEAESLPDAVLAYRDAMRRVAAQTDSPLVDGPAHFVRSGASIGHFYDQVHPASPGHALIADALLEAIAP